MLPVPLLSVEERADLEDALAGFEDSVMDACWWVDTLVYLVGDDPDAHSVLVGIVDPE